MLQMQPTLPYSNRVEVPDTDLIIPPIRRFLPQTEPNFEGLAAYRAKPFFFACPIRTERHHPFRRHRRGADRQIQTPVDRASDWGVQWLAHAP